MLHVHVLSCWHKSAASGIAHLLAHVSALQQVRWLVVLQVTGTGVGAMLQQQTNELLLVRASMQTSCHVEGRVAVGLRERWHKDRERIGKNLREQIGRMNQRSVLPCSVMLK